MSPLFQDELTKIKEVLANGGKNVFIELNDDFIREYIENEITKEEISKIKFIKIETRELNTFLNELGNKVSEIYRRMMRGGVFNNVGGPTLSPQAQIIRTTEFITDYSRIVLIVDRMEGARGSVINFLNDITALMNEKKGVGVFIANSLLYTSETEGEISKIKNSPRTIQIKMENLSFDDFRAAVEREYFIPLDILHDIYVKSRGNLENTFAFMITLRRKGFIDDAGRWSASEHISIDFPSTQDEVFKYKFNIFEDSVKNFARWLSLFEDGINPKGLQELSGLNESVFINSLESLREIGLVEIKNQKVYFKDEAFRKYVKKLLSEYSLGRMAKIAIQTINDQSPAMISLLLEAQEQEKAEELALKMTRHIDSRNLLRSKEIVEEMLRTRRTERLLLRYARILLYQGMNDEASNILDEVEKSNSNPRSGFYSLKAWLISGSGPEDRFQELYDRAEEEDDKAWILYYKLYFLWQKGDASGVRDLGNLLINGNYPDQIKAESLRILGNIAYESGMNDEAMKYYNRGLELASQVQDSKNKARLLNNIANIYFENNQKKALELLEEAKKVAIDSLDMDVYTIVLFNLILTEYEYRLVSYKDAISRLKRIKTIYEQYGTAYSRINYLITLAEMMTTSLELDDVLPMLDQGENLMEDLGNTWDKLRIDTLRGTVKFLKGDRNVSGIESVDERSVYDYVLQMNLLGKYDEAIKVRHLLKKNSNLDLLMNVLISFGNGMDVREYIQQIKPEREDIYTEAARQIASIQRGGKIEFERFIESGTILYPVSVAHKLDDAQKKQLKEVVKSVKGISIENFL